MVGTQGDERLHGYDADTGEVIYAGGGADELMSGTRQWNTGIAARGRMYFAADNKVYAFKLPIATPTPTPTATATPKGTANPDANGNVETGTDPAASTKAGAASNSVARSVLMLR